MKSKQFAVRALVVGVTLCGAYGGAQAQTLRTVDECRYLVGYPLQTGAWKEVRTHWAAFLSSGPRLQECVIKEGDGAGKGKPKTVTVYPQTAEGQLTMTQDECGMYGSLATADRKLNQAKVGDAYVTMSAMVAKLNDLFGAGKLEQSGYEAMFGAAGAAQQCILELMSQP